MFLQKLQPSLKGAAKLYPFLCMRVSAKGSVLHEQSLSTVGPVSSYCKLPSYSTGHYSALLNCCFLLHLLSL